MSSLQAESHCADRAVKLMRRRRPLFFITKPPRFLRPPPLKMSNYEPELPSSNEDELRGGARRERRPSLPGSNEDELRARTYSYEMSWLEYEIRKAERDYHTLVKKAAWSDDDCAEADAIQRFIAAHREAIADLEASYHAGAH